IRDSAASLEHTIAQLEHAVDAIILTGGASVGAHDISKYVLSSWQHDDPELAITFNTVNIRPGKPQGFGLSPAGTPVWSLPGNPVAVLVSLRLFVAPGLAKMQRRAPHPRKLRVYTTRALSTPKKVNHYMLATLDVDQVTALSTKSQGDMNMAHTTDLVQVPDEGEHIEANKIVEYLPLRCPIASLLRPPTSSGTNNSRSRPKPLPT